MTGGGKSTTVDVMLGLLTPTSGRVTVDGVDIRGNEKARHESLGVVHQTVFLADTTIRRNVALGVPEDEIDQALVTEAIRLAQLEDFVASLQEGLDSVVGQRGVRLSGGQRQRLAIARALYRRPSVLMFEGTSAPRQRHRKRAAESPRSAAREAHDHRCGTPPEYRRCFGSRHPGR